MYINPIIYIDERYLMRANKAKLDQMRALRLDGGEASFVASLGRLSLPEMRGDWPSIDMIRQANLFRGITT